MADAIFKPKWQGLLVFCLVLLRVCVFGQVISKAQPYDIIISEFMADPTPSRGLPEAEFIELYNRTANKYFNLKDYRIMNGKDTTLLKSDTIKPQQYKIIYKKASDINFGKFGDTIPVSKLGSLSNPQDLFYLISSKDTVIDAANYDLTLYQDSKKAIGGYTLERTKVSSPCNPMGWVASDKSNGGTPGKVNSVLPILSDSFPLEIERYYLGTDNLVIVFNKSLSRKSALDTIHYKLLEANSKITPIKIDSPLFNVVQFKISPALTANSSYHLLVKNSLKDCLDSSSRRKNDTLLLKLSEKLIRNDLVVNEILTNPETGGSRFIELYNNSNKVFDVSKLKIGNDTTASDNIKISSDMLILPREYIVFTDNPLYIQKRYNAVAFRKRILKQKLPAWNDNADNVTLSFTDGTKTIILDSFNYQKSWHNPLLANTEGVSLERVNPKDTSVLSSNWQSAAQTVGYATPAQKNSQLDTSNNKPTNQVFSLQKKTFSPDSDGFEDFLSLNYRFDKGGYSATIHIFTDKGKLVKTLIPNGSLNTEGSIIWEGDTDEGQTARAGIYILSIEWVHKNGQVQRTKLPCVLTGRF